MSITLRRIAATLTVALAAITIAPRAEAFKGECAFGPKAGYVSKNSSAIAGLTFQYGFSKHFRLAPEVSYAFRHRGMDALIVDLNAQMPFNFVGERAALYPLAGFTYQSWNRKNVESNGEGADVSTREGKFGINAGAGFELRCSSTLKLTLEARYSLLKRYSGAQVTLGIAYVF